MFAYICILSLTTYVIMKQRCKINKMKSKENNYQSRKRKRESF